MKMLRKILILLLLIPIVGFSESSEKPITIGLIHFSAPLSNDMDFSPSLKHLQKVFAPREVIAKVYSSADLENAVKEGKIDFFYASSGFFYRMLRFGARDIATVVTNEKPEPNFGTAGAFITRRDRTDIKTLEDMRDKIFAANYESAFHGYRIGMAELVKHGYDPKHFFSSTHFVGESADKLLDEVISGRAEVAFIRACWLEEHEYQNIAVFDKIKVVAPRPGKIACLHSTSAYPNNTFAATFSVKSELARQVAVALLSMKPGPTGQHWSIATDFKPVDELYKSLRVGPYEYLNQWSAKRVLKEFWPIFAIIILGVLGLIVHSWRAQKLIDRATKRLLAAERTRREVEKRAQELTAKMETEQKLNLVAQLSSMFAHEMNQPLAACKYFVDGLKALLRNKTAISDSVLLYSVSNMDKELGRASSIVNKVREYSKQTASRDSKVDISSILHEICQTLAVKFPEATLHTPDIEESVFIEADAVEIEILVWNLLKNALEECSAVQGTTDIQLKTSGETACLTVSNEGRKMSEQDVKNLSLNVLKSDKREGLGLGLKVVHTILEAMNGTIDFRANDNGGLTVKVCFGLWKEESDGNRRQD